MLNRLTRLSPHSPTGFLLRLPLRLIPRSLVVPVLSGVNRNARWIVGASTHACWLGNYEPEQQAFIADNVKPGRVIWDVGANAGFYTLAFSRLTGPTGQVYAFEPLAENAQHLLRHIRLNQRANCVVVQAALSDATGVSGFTTVASNSMGHLSSTGNYRVPTLRTDEFIARFPESRPRFIKMDVEGAEADVLAGARDLLREHGPDVLLSLHSDEQAHRCRELLLSCGYSLHRLDGGVIKSGEQLSAGIFAQKH